MTPKAKAVAMCALEVLGWTALAAGITAAVLSDTLLPIMAVGCAIVLAGFMAWAAARAIRDRYRSCVARYSQGEDTR